MTISASILSSDLSNIEDTLKLLHKNNIDWLHFDVMDGHFVPKISFGSDVLKCIRQKTDMYLDVHLMVSNPEEQIPKFLEAGADSITFHLEATENPRECIDLIHKGGIKAGIASNPSTPVEAFFDYLHLADLFLIMSVEPGEGGQQFLKSALGKLSKSRINLERRGISAIIQVDGGINRFTASQAKNIGATNIVSGSYLINGLKNLKKHENIEELFDFYE